MSRPEPKATIQRPPRPVVPPVGDLVEMPATVSEYNRLAKDDIRSLTKEIQKEFEARWEKGKPLNGTLKITLRVRESGRVTIVTFRPIQSEGQSLDDFLDFDSSFWANKGLRNALRKLAKDQQFPVHPDGRSPFIQVEVHIRAID